MATEGKLLDNNEDDENGKNLYINYNDTLYDDQENQRDKEKGGGIFQDHDNLKDPSSSKEKPQPTSVFLKKLNGWKSSRQGHSGSSI